MYEIKGKIYEIGMTRQVSDSFRVRDLIIEDETAKPEYPSYVSLQATQASCDELEHLAAGDIVTVGFFLNGRKWEKNGEVKFFNSLNISKIDVESTANSVVTPPSKGTAAQAPAPQEDDLPF